MKKIVFILLGFLMILLSCNKLHDTFDINCKVVTVTTQDGVSTFEYDDNDKIISITNQPPNLKIIIGYDEVGRIIKMERYTMHDNTLKGYSNFNWVDNNHVDSYSYYYSVNYGAWLEDIDKIELNDNGNQIKREFYQKDENENWFVSSYIEICWNKGNLVSTEFFTRDSEKKEFKKINTHLYEYDTKINPWRNLSIRSVIFDFSIFPISANNPVTERMTFNTARSSLMLKKDYQYNSLNYPVSYIQTKIDAET
ncbi:MAG: hypothetical protein DRJ09_05545 [Bacteroidetes bacterium]|nr:MAG: hypothetical protein DRJ09_05545 [Bacteroidota bacterium]